MASLQDILIKNPSYGRHRISQPMQIVALILFFPLALPKGLIGFFWPSFLFFLPPPPLLPPLFFLLFFFPPPPLFSWCGPFLGLTLYLENQVSFKLIKNLNLVSKKYNRKKITKKIKLRHTVETVNWLIKGLLLKKN